MVTTARKNPLSARRLAPKGDLNAPACPSRGVLEHVTSRWGVLILVALTEGTHRFSQLRRTVGGVSEKMLSQTLQHLEADGFVTRTVHPVIPPHVDYALTPLGEEVALRVGDLAGWIEDNLGRVMVAREKVAARGPRRTPH